VIPLFSVVLGVNHSQWPLRHIAGRIDDYNLGESIGTCIAAKYRVFRGYLLTRSSAPCVPVEIRFEEWLFGPPSAGDLPGSRFHPLSFADVPQSDDNINHLNLL
jgi:hypothetical protein